MSGRRLALRNSEVYLIWRKFPGVLDRIQCVLRDVDDNGGVTIEVPDGGQAGGFYPGSSVYDVVAVEPDDAMYSGNRPKLRRAIRDYIWNLGEQERYQFATHDLENLAIQTGPPLPWVEGTFLGAAGDIWSGRVTSSEGEIVSVSTPSAVPEDWILIEFDVEKMRDAGNLPRPA